MQRTLRFATGNWQAASTRCPERPALRTLSNESINKTLRTLALILDEAEDAGWIERNVARGRRTREKQERRPNRGVLDVDEFLTMLVAARQLDAPHRPETLERAAEIRLLRDEAGVDWKTIAKRVGVAPTTAMYLHGCSESNSCGVRRAIIATLGLAGLRVGELCLLDVSDLNLAKARLTVRDAKTEAGVRSVDIHPSLLDELTSYRASDPSRVLESPAFPTRAGTRPDRANVLKRVIHPVVARTNEIRNERDEPPILAHVTPHTLRRTYITFLVAAGYDLPYVQAQVGHRQPTTTLAIYAQLMARQDRDALRAEIRQLLGAAEPRHEITPATTSLRTIEKAGKGRALTR